MRPTLQLKKVHPPSCSSFLPYPVSKTGRAARRSRLILKLF
ncbi:hypothetical protein NSU_4170 [Novosphingobium pentaromativorans US6-1]|uniref:Uncharacterized protein n=1 Tax=Novosphingobium pentaromativorans US6-1 TaxID=1088721 RepID=G6EIJ9_9SPHN|nr:hypothetical protein NSU_4170 [Novosphingobium pentaromativorans US6-1]